MVEQLAVLPKWPLLVSFHRFHDKGSSGDDQEKDGDDVGGCGCYGGGCDGDEVDAGGCDGGDAESDWAGCSGVDPAWK